MLKQLKNKIDAKQKIIFCCLILILLIPNLYTLLHYTDLKGNWLISISYITLCLSVLLLPLVVLRIKTFFRIGWIFLLLSGLEIGSVKSLGAPISEGFLEAILNTNFQETLEQLSTNKEIIIFILIIASLYYILTSKLTLKSIDNKSKYFILSFFLILNVILIFKMYTFQADSGSFSSKANYTLAITLMKYQKIYPIDLLLNINNIFYNSRNKQNFGKNFNEFSFQAKQYKSSQKKEIYVLVIGESARYSSFHINGYSRQTSPNLDNLDNLISFSNVFSPATLTFMSLPQLITRATPDNLNLQFEEKSIIDAFKEAGFYTAWISTQNENDPAIKRLRGVTNYFHSSKLGLDNNSPYDTDIISNFKTVLKENGNRKFIVIHSLGSHFRYSKRYPPSFEKFKPALARVGFDNIHISNKTKFINSYDNSILFTDFFLDLLIKELKNTEAVCTLTYVSDHGENLFDDERGLIQHGTENPGKEEYHIPLFIWFSNQYQKENSEKTLAILNNKDKKAMSNTTFYTMLDLANIGYHNSDQELQKSIASPQYKEPTERKLISASKKIILIN